MMTIFLKYNFIVNYIGSPLYLGGLYLIMARNIQEYVAERVIQYLNDSDEQLRRLAYETKRLRGQLKIFKQATVRIGYVFIQCAHCNVYLYDRDSDWVDWDDQIIHFLDCCGCDYAVCDDCLGKCGWDTFYSSVCDLCETTTCDIDNHRNQRVHFCPECVNAIR